jgi:hypothetical protein
MDVFFLKKNGKVVLKLAKQNILNKKVTYEDIISHNRYYFLCYWCDKWVQSESTWRPINSLHV